jgi:hypothetical protein
VWKSKQSKKPTEAGGKHLLYVDFLLHLLFDPEEGSDTFFRNIHGLLPDYTASHSRKQYSSQSQHLDHFCISSIETFLNLGFEMTSFTNNNNMNALESEVHLNNI